MWEGAGREGKREEQRERQTEAQEGGRDEEWAQNVGVLRTQSCAQATARNDAPVQPWQAREEERRQAAKHECKQRMGSERAPAHGGQMPSLLPLSLPLNALSATALATPPSIAAFKPASYLPPTPNTKHQTMKT